MTIGIAVDAGDVDHDQLSQAFCALSAYEVIPDAICVPLDTVRALLACFATSTPSDPSSALPSKPKRQLHTFAALPVHTAVCARDFLSNCDVIFGEQFDCCSVKKLRSYRAHLPLLWHGGRLLTGRCIRQSTLLLALNQMGSEKVIILCNRHTIRQNTPKCFYLNLDIPDVFEQDRYRIQLLDFLYFPPGNQRWKNLSSFQW